MIIATPQKNALAGLNPSAVSRFADWLTCLGVVQRRLPAVMAVFRKVELASSQSKALAQRILALILWGWELVHIKKSISRPREKRLFQKRHLHHVFMIFSDDHWDHYHQIMTIVEYPGKTSLGMRTTFVLCMEGQRHHNVRYVLPPARRFCLTLQCNNLGVGNKTYLWSTPALVSLLVAPTCCIQHLN